MKLAFFPCLGLPPENPSTFTFPPCQEDGSGIELLQLLLGWGTSAQGEFAASPGALRGTEVV